MNARERPPHVEMRGITKRFGPVVANAGIDLDIRRGEIHALLGENGAGKTTLMNILYGLLRPDGGEIRLEDRPVSFASSLDAIAAGIGMVHQHFMLVPTLTIAENTLLGGPGGFVLRREQIREVRERLLQVGARYGLEVDPDALVWQLSVGEQQRAEILRALYRNAQLLILDEPTASLAPTEIAQLLPKLQDMAADGAAIVIITHHLDEVMACADRITVLRKGEHVATLDREDTNTAELARLMVGRDVSLAAVLTGDAAEHSAASSVEASGGGAPSTGPSLLSVEDLSARNDRGLPSLHGVSFNVEPGEIVTIAGVEGNGQAELEEVLFGLRQPTGGRFVVTGRDMTGRTPAQLLASGVGYIPSDRYRHGLIRDLSIAENLVFDRLDRPPFGTRVSLNRRAIVQRGIDLIRRFSIQADRPEQPAGSLSGGNSQRVVLARALSSDLRLLIAAQPTRGLDVGAIEFVWEQLREQRDRGVGIVLVSTDLDEVFALADRCHVIYRGEFVAHLERSELDRPTIGLAMGGSVERVGAGGSGGPG